MSNSVCLHSGPEFSIDAEMREGLVFLHCQVDKPSKSVLQEIKAAFATVLNEISEYDQVAAYAITPNERFVKFLNQPYEVLDTSEGHRLISWPLDLQ